MIAIKTGTTGRRPLVTEWIWRGSAEVLVYGCARVPAAWVMTDTGRHAAIVRHDEDWWDARCMPSREWEHDDSSLIEGDMAREIDGYLRLGTMHHERTARDLNRRAAGE